MLAFSNDYYGMIFRATQSVELFCAYGTGDHGTVKGRKSDGMGSENEQYIIVCKGDCGYRDGLSIMEIK